MISICWLWRVGHLRFFLFSQIIHWNNKEWIEFIQYLYTDKIIFCNASDSSRKRPFTFFFSAFFSEIIQLNLWLFYTFAVFFFLIWVGNFLQNGSARGVMVIVVGNGYGDTSSKPERDWLHFIIALIPLGKVWIQLFSLQLRVNSRAD